MNTSNIIDDDKLATAHHEAGHLVAAYAMGDTAYANIWPCESQPIQGRELWEGYCRYHSRHMQRLRKAIRVVAADFAVLRISREWDDIDPLDVVDFHVVGFDASYADDAVADDLDRYGMSTVDLTWWDRLNYPEQIRAANMAVKILQTHDAELAIAVNMLLTTEAADTYDLMPGGPPWKRQTPPRVAVASD